MLRLLLLGFFIGILILILRFLFFLLRESLDIVKVEELAALVKPSENLGDDLPRLLLVVLVDERLLEQIDAALKVSQDIEVPGKESSSSTEGWDDDFSAVRHIGLVRSVARLRHRSTSQCGVLGDLFDRKLDAACDQLSCGRPKPVRIRQVVQYLDVVDT